MNANEQKELEKVKSQFASTQDILRRAYAALSDGYFVSDCNVGLPEMISAFAQQLRAAQEEITALKSDDGLTTAYMCGFHKRDDEMRLLKEENERLKAELAKERQYNAAGTEYLGD